MSNGTGDALAPNETSGDLSHNPWCISGLSGLSCCWCPFSYEKPRGLEMMRRHYAAWVMEPGARTQAERAAVNATCWPSLPRLTQLGGAVNRAVTSAKGRRCIRGPRPQSVLVTLHLAGTTAVEIAAVKGGRDFPLSPGRSAELARRGWSRSPDDQRETNATAENRRDRARPYSAVRRRPLGWSPGLPRVYFKPPARAWTTSPPSNWLRRRQVQERSP